MDYKSDNRRAVYSRWASAEEICASLHKVDLHNFASPYGGIPLYTNETSAWIEARDVHSLIIGATGSKKTRLIGMPAIRMYGYAGESFIATDPKGELYEHSYHLLKELDYAVYVLNLRDPSRSNTWNPLWIPFKLYHRGYRDRAIEMVLDLCASMISRGGADDPYWSASARNMLTGLMLVLFECANAHEINLKSLLKLRTQAFIGEPAFITEYFLDHIDPSSFATSLLSGSAEVHERTRSCIVSVFDQQMNTFFCQDKLVNMLSGNEINFEELGNKKTAVFLILPDENTLYHSLVSVFVKQCYSQLIHTAQQRETKTLSVRVNFLLDEFSTLPPISDFSAMITAARSRNIRFNLMIQSIFQLRVRYGDEAETIKGNCGNWIFLYSRELSVLNELGNLAGMANNDDPLISAAQLQRLDKHKGEAFILHERQYPFITTLKDISEYPDVACGTGKIPYPQNTSKVKSVFDFKTYCESHSTTYLSRLFGDAKPETDMWPKDNVGRPKSDSEWN